MRYLAQSSIKVLIHLFVKLLRNTRSTLDNFSEKKCKGPKVFLRICLYTFEVTSHQTSHQRKDLAYQSTTWHHHVDVLIMCSA